MGRRHVRIPRVPAGPNLVEKELLWIQQIPVEIVLHTSRFGSRQWNQLEETRLQGICFLGGGTKRGDNHERVGRHGLYCIAVSFRFEVGES